MPVPDPLASVGYLVAAGAVTAVAVGGYAVALVRWLRSAQARNAQLRAQDEDRRPAL